MNELREKILSLIENDIFDMEARWAFYEYFPEYIKKMLSDYLLAINDSELWTKFINVHYPNNPET